MSIRIHYCRQGQEDVRVCPCTAYLQCIGSVVYQFIQCQLVHYYLQKRNRTNNFITNVTISMMALHCMRGFYWRHYLQLIKQMMYQLAEFDD